MPQVFSGLDSLNGMPCNRYKIAISQIALKVSRTDLASDSLLYALARPHGACTYGVLLWLGVVRVHALLRAGRYTDTVRTSDSLLVPHAAAMRPSEVAVVRYYKGAALWHLDQYLAAGPLMKAARRYYKGTTDHLITATINAGLGYYYRAVGDTTAALCAFEYAYRTVKRAGDYSNMLVVRRRVLEGLASLDTNIDTEKACRAGEVRRQNNGDGLSHGQVWTLILIGVAILSCLAGLTWRPKKRPVQKNKRER